MATHAENFLGGMRDDTECKAEEMEDMRRKNKEEEVKSRKIKVEGRGDRVQRNSNGFALASFSCFRREKYG